MWRMSTARLISISSPAAPRSSISRRNDGGPSKGPPSPPSLGDAPAAPRRPSRMGRARLETSVTLLSPRPLERLVDVRVGQRLERIGPRLEEMSTLCRRARPAVPADLLHVVVELYGVAGGIEDVGMVVDTGRELGRHVQDLHVVLAQPAHGVLELLIARHLAPERHERGGGAEAEWLPQSLRDQGQAVVLGALTEEHAALAAHLD